jgi:DNA replication protein DnaC
MQKDHHLTMNLKRLKMPGILENIDLRLKEAGDNDLGYLEFLGLLVQDEINSREANILSKRLRNGGLSPRYTFESFDYRFNGDAIAPQTIRDLASCHFIQQNRGLILCGPPGIGKTHIAQAIGHEVCRRGGDALFIKTHKLLEDLLDSSYPRRAARLWKWVGSVDLLILDDFGFRRYEQKESEVLYTLADERLGNASTIITSNRPAQDWYGVFPDPVIGGAILDRFVSGAIKIFIEKAKSYRKHVSEMLQET